MKSTHLAHITTVNGIRTEQSATVHSTNTAKYSSEILKNIGLRNTGYCAGILHDMGKYTEKFTKYLEDAYEGKPVIKGSVNHTFAAVIYLFEKYHLGKNMGYDTVACEIIGFAVGSHHGLFDCVNLKKENGFEHRIFKDKHDIAYKEAVENYFAECINEVKLEEIFNDAIEEIEKIFNRIKEDSASKNSEVKYLVGMLARVVTSALIDGDRRDTTEFMNGILISKKMMTEGLWGNQLNFLEEKLKGFTVETPINKARMYISDACSNFAINGNGIYKITVPTGGGKTLSTLRYALRHAKMHNKKRIIFIIPLLSVLDQNSKVIRNYIKDKDIVTEHHSNVVRVSESREELDQFELLNETWSSPIIISTLVQLLNTFFAAKTSSIRRMNSLIESVIVIDEIQSLPSNMISLFNMVINFLVFYCKGTVVLSSATQPCFEKTVLPLKLSKEPNIVPRNSMLEVFKRTTVIDRTTSHGMKTEELADFVAEIISEKSSLLVVCNTKTTALKMFTKMKQRNINKEYIVFHLSTSMCMQHRIDVLEKIIENIKTKKKVVCIATQLVEAGVDFSFECVIRIKAGMDNIVQAAGRCNRNGEFGKICIVYIVNLNDEKLEKLKDIRISQECTEQLLYNYLHSPNTYDNDLLSEKSIQGYYKELFNKNEYKNSFKYPIIIQGVGETLYDLLSENERYVAKTDISRLYFLNQAFKTAGEHFKVFDDRTTDIIVPYNQEAEDLIADLCSKKTGYNYEFFQSRIENAKKYTINIYDYQKNELDEYGMIYSDDGKHFTALNPQCYNEETGLEIETSIL